VSGLLRTGLDRIPGKILCVGRNYAAHAKEMGNEVPERPIFFLKPTTALIGDGETILLPEQSTRVEHEAEIAVVLGSNLRHADEEEAREAVAGVVCANDVTARDLQQVDSQWTRPKGFDTFCPIGPAVRHLPPDFDLTGLEVFCRVNGELRQHGRATDMHFSIPYLLSWISRVMTLEAGDILSTGTPEGVGPLTDGDVVEVEIPEVGVLRNPVRSAQST
jgi:2-keto-4-pentenoate hydratase/2-oxohepta-3-ene-1,7-dioic acid hydratase in catechol pathway